MGGWLMDHWRRCGLVLLGIVYFVQAAMFGLLVNDEPFMPYAWPTLSVIAGVTVMLFTARLASDRLCIAAGISAFAAFVARPIGVAARFLEGDVLGPRLVLSLIAYTLLSLGIAFFWYRGVAPWHDGIKAGTRKG